MATHHCNQCTRIQPAGEKYAKRYIAHKVALDRMVQQFALLFDSILITRQIRLRGKA